MPSKERYQSNKSEHLDYQKTNYRKHKESCPEKFMWRAARRRALANHIPFDIEVSDIHIPDVCPILNIPIKPSLGKIKGDSPTLDKINPMLGYVRGNIAVISARANSHKSDMSFEDIERLYLYVKKHGFPAADGTIPDDWIK